MEGDEVGADPDQGWGEGEEKKEEDCFAPFRFARAGGEGEEKGEEEQALEPNGGGG
jgi:hypothetical protein